MCWRAWPKAWAFAPRPGCLRSTQTRSCNGWWKPLSNSRPFPPIFSVMYTCVSYNSTSCMPCCAASRMVRSVKTTPSSAWTVLDPESKLLVAIDSGPRTLAMAQRVVHQVVGVLALGCVPAWFSNGFKGYLPAIVGHFGLWVHPGRSHDKGPWPKPRWMPLPGLLYAQVVKSYRRRRIVAVKHRVVFGTLEAVEQVLAACGWKINTAFVERLNLDIRQCVAAVGRRVNTLCKGEDGMQHQLALFHAYHNFVLPHASLRQPLQVPEPTNGPGPAKRWRPYTPAMAAGLTDHVWTLQEVLLYRVPPWPQPQTV